MCRCQRTRSSRFQGDGLWGARIAGTYACRRHVDCPPGLLSPEARGASSVITRAARTMIATVDPSAATTGILLSARTPNEDAAATPDMRMEGGGSSPRAWLSAVNMAYLWLR